MRHMMRIGLALVAGLGALGAAAGCSNRAPGGCASTANCSSGSVCIDRACVQLCTSDLGCPEGEICQDSLCAQGTRTAAPTLFTIDGNGDVADRIWDGLRIQGENLEGVTVALAGPVSATLDIRAATATALEVVLPADIIPSLADGSGDYTLTVSNQLGSAQETVRLLQGEQGPPGAPADGPTVLSLLAPVDGSGSGLDADTLDGLHGDAFVRRSGDQMTGDLTFAPGASLGVGTDVPVGPLQVMGSAAGEVAANPSSTALSNSGLDSFNPGPVVDGDVATNAWHTDSAATGAFLGIAPAAPMDYVRARLYASAAGYKGNYTVRYSDDNSVWSTAASSFIPARLGWNEIAWSSVGAHPYWRLELANTPGAGPWISELELYAAGAGAALTVNDDGRVACGDALEVAGEVIATGDVRARGYSVTKAINIRSVVTKADANAQCGTATAIHVPWSYRGKTGREICAADTRGLTNCTSVEYVYVTIANGFGSYDTNNLTCDDPVNMPWPWGSVGSTRPDSLDAEWGHGDTWVVCCN